MPVEVETRRGAADRAVLVNEPQMVWKKELLMTLAVGQVSAGHGDDPMEESFLSEGHVTAVDVLQGGGQVPLEDLFDDGMPWYSFFGRCERRMV